MKEEDAVVEDFKKFRRFFRALAFALFMLWIGTTVSAVASVYQLKTMHKLETRITELESQLKEIK